MVKKENKIFIVTAYRWGLRDNSSWVIGSYSTLKMAKKVAKDYIGYRGGKYGCEVVESIVDKEHNPDNMNACHQVSYTECTYFGAAGRFFQSMEPADRNKQDWEKDPFIDACKEVIEVYPSCLSLLSNNEGKSKMKQCLDKLRPFLEKFAHWR